MGVKVNMDDTCDSAVREYVCLNCLYWSEKMCIKHEILNKKEYNDYCAHHSNRYLHEDDYWEVLD